MAPICSIESVNNKLKLSLNKMGFTIESIQLSAMLCMLCGSGENFDTAWRIFIKFHTE